MRMKSQLAITLSLFLLLPASLLVAQEKPVDASEAPVVALIKQLASSNFAERQAASQQLTKLGEQAIPRLTAAALGDNREAVTRSVDILKGHLKSANEKLQSAAKAALKKISAIENGVGPRLRCIEEAVIGASSGEQITRPRALEASPRNHLRYCESPTPEPPATHRRSRA